MLERVTITIPTDQLAAIDQLASTLRISRSAAIRQAIDLFLAVNISKTPMIDAVYQRRRGDHGHVPPAATAADPVTASSVAEPLQVR